MHRFRHGLLLATPGGCVSGTECTGRAYTRVVPAGCFQARLRKLVEDGLQGTYLICGRCVQQRQESFFFAEFGLGALLAADSALIDTTCDQRRDDESSHGHTGIDHLLFRAASRERLPWNASASAKAISSTSVAPTSSVSAGNNQLALVVDLGCAASAGPDPSRATSCVPL